MIHSDYEMYVFNISYQLYKHDNDRCSAKDTELLPKLGTRKKWWKKLILYLKIGHFSNLQLKSKIPSSNRVPLSMPLTERNDDIQPGSGSKRWHDPGLNHEIYRQVERCNGIQDITKYSTMQLRFAPKFRPNWFWMLLLFWKIRSKAKYPRSVRCIARLTTACACEH